MNIICKKPTISEYIFFKLLTSSIIINNENPIIENHQLEKDLYSFYNKPEYHFLFEDICKKEDNICNNNYIDLSVAFQTAYAFGLLLKIHDNNSKLRSIINLSSEEAKKLQSEYNSKEIQSVTNLCNELFNKKEKAKRNMLIKKK